MLRPSWGVAVICNGFLFLRTTSNPPGPTGPGRQYAISQFQHRPPPRPREIPVHQRSQRVPVRPYPSVWFSDGYGYPN
ncbi:hypothetical protein PF005_g33036 [Phytophthora fragariae]|uniref:Secreted protein n=1 Tax=Phytophthora fragariae TaxID=53985 RepID=A0A6A3V4Q8_9STRA|nr:hypothetical protein PF003_g38601 [Phytophthora fragariae]KAE8919553.1 hypothetical protein PF009_g30141 [Phytophthora fragariae]KAE8950838.1 hypothetical protein PF011_g33121 [Phytophthora fragariae]KAE9053823.1 hypothetical protein PF007_g32835 [Phytophthora fragariae]KAE9054131.1 hypothetical protein PF010_g32664 [Phytophthora fragariae]